MIKGNNLCFPFGHLYVKVICHLKMRSVEQNLTKSLAKVKVTDGFQSLHSKRLSAVSGTINLETLLNICASWILRTVSGTINLEREKKNYQFGHSLNIWISWILTTYSFFLNIMYCIFANAQLILEPQPYQGFALKYKVNISTPCSYLLSKWSYRNHRHRGDWLPAQQDEFWWSYISRASTVVFWLFQYAMKTTSFHMQ